MYMELIHGGSPSGRLDDALPLESLRAAVPLRMVTPVPLSPPHVIGILRFQGQILTAMSLSSLLGGRGWREDPAVLLVVDPGMGGRLLALDCQAGQMRMLEVRGSRGDRERAAALRQALAGEMAALGVRRNWLLDASGSWS